MVTKSRLSPFANTRARRQKKNIGRKLEFTNSSGSNPTRLKRLRRWFSLIDAALSQKKVLLPVKKLKGSFLLIKELHHTLSGFIVFEVCWDDVRGINYLNELQTDTSMALEAKLMKRWEFDSIEQASSTISLWYSGTDNEQLLLRDYLDNVSNKGDVFYDALDSSLLSSTDAGVHVRDNDDVHNDKVYDDSCNLVYHPGMEHTTSLPCTPPTPPPNSGPYKRRKIMKSSIEVDEVSGETYSEIVSSPVLSVSSFSQSLENENTRLVSEATNYKDVLILFRFDDHGLPFRLKEIIMSDLRLLTLLEYGLPSWVIFLQSYPVFCQIYRPWMCPLARALYVLISMVTVLIGFYDLYKNVPLLKATASRLFGPFFDWIETWEMISRIKYLGTMLFLHNFEKAVKWFLMITRATRSLLSVLLTPIAGPVVELAEFILPFWNLCLETIESICSVIWFVCGSSCSAVMGILHIILWPFWLILSAVWSTATLVVCPVVWLFWEIAIAPVRLILAMASFMSMFFSNAYYFLKEGWSSISVLFEFASTSEASVGAYEASMWRSLWNDLFSQVFRALRSILYGFVAFFATCNRHRLSIYNHVQALLLRISHATRPNVTRSCSHSGSCHGCQKHGAQGPLEESERSPSKSHQKLRRRQNMNYRDGGSEEVKLHRKT